MKMKEQKTINLKTKQDIFPEMTLDQLTEIFSTTIKGDKENSLITYLSMLSAYTAQNQFNISFNAPSSTGKSYIPMEIAKYFPPEDVIQIAYCSPTAFFHDKGEFDERTKKVKINLERKIIVFLDQPHMQLIERLRPMLSHDQKEIEVKITDKNRRSGMRTKNIVLIGYPSVIFCTAGLQFDDQEATRFILLSPEITQEKIRQAIQEKTRKESNLQDYLADLSDNPERKLLERRIKAIKSENTQEILLPADNNIVGRFLDSKKLKPRHMRDIGRLISIIKAITLHNIWNRDRKGLSIIATQTDIDYGFKLWNTIQEAQEFNLPPYLLQIFKRILKPLWHKQNSNEKSGRNGIERKSVLEMHKEIFGNSLSEWKLRKEVIPMIEAAGLIYQAPDKNDRRKALIYLVEEKISC